MKNKIKTAGKAIVNFMGSWASVIIGLIALGLLFENAYLSCYAMIGLAILFALWDIDSKTKTPTTLGANLMYWIKLRKVCLRFAEKSIKTERLTQRKDEAQQIIEGADKYFNYIISGRIPLTEEQKKELQEQKNNAEFAQRQRLISAALQLVNNSFPDIMDDAEAELNQALLEMGIETKYSANERTE